MATLAERSIKNTFKNLIQVDNSNSGLDATLRQVEDGGGNTTPLYLSSGKLKIQPGENSTTLLEVKNAAGTSLLTINSTSGEVTIPTLNSTTFECTTINGVIIGHGITANRPSLDADDICIWYDETINSWIFWNGTGWV